MSGDVLVLSGASAGSLVSRRAREDRGPRAKRRGSGAGECETRYRQAKKKKRLLQNGMKGWGAWLARVWGADEPRHVVPRRPSPYFFRARVSHPSAVRRGARGVQPRLLGSIWHSCGEVTRGEEGERTIQGIWGREMTMSSRLNVRRGTEKTGRVARTRVRGL